MAQYYAFEVTNVDDSGENPYTNIVVIDSFDMGDVGAFAEKLTADDDTLINCIRYLGPVVLTTVSSGRRGPLRMSRRNGPPLKPDR